VGCRTTEVNTCQWSFVKVNNTKNNGNGAAGNALFIKQQTANMKITKKETINNDGKEGSFDVVN
jgi:hypothetical protein